jgi:hypothetical protein
MTRYTLDSIEGLALGLRLAHRSERYLDQALAVHLLGFEEIVKDTPLQVGVYWNSGRTDMLVADQIPDFTFSLESAKRLLPRNANARVFSNVETSEATAVLRVSSGAYSGAGRSPALALCAACVAYEVGRRRTSVPRLAVEMDLGQQPNMASFGHQSCA